MRKINDEIKRLEKKSKPFQGKRFFSTKLLRNMKKFFVAVIICATGLSAFAVTLVPENAELIANKFRYKDFSKGLKGWRKPSNMTNKIIEIKNGALFCSGKSARIERTANYLKAKTGKVPHLMTAKVFIEKEMKNTTAGANCGIYTKNWKKSTKKCTWNVRLGKATKGKWVRLQSKPCVLGDDVRIILVNAGLFWNSEGRAMVDDIGIYPAEATFNLKPCTGEKIQSVIIRNIDGKTVFESQAPISEKIILPFPFTKFTGEATLQNGNKVKFVYPHKLFVRDGKGKVELKAIFYHKRRGGREHRVADEARRIIQAFTGQNLPVKPVKKALTSQEAKGAFIVGNDIWFVDELKALFAKDKREQGAAIIHDGSIVVAGTTNLLTVWTLYKLFEDAGFKFYVSSLSWSPFRRFTAEICESYPAEGEIILEGNHREFLRYGSFGPVGNARITKEFKEKQYGMIWGSHTADLLVPQSIYIKKHPEYYALLPNGKRLGKTPSMGIPPSMGVHLCYSNPEVLKIAVKNLCNWIVQQPEAEYFDVGHGDGANWCTCAKCKAMDVPGTGYSGRFWAFTIKLARAVKEKFPNKKLRISAYTPRTEYPPANLKIPNNVVVQLCTYCWGGERSQTQPYSALPNRIAKRSLKRWLKLLGPKQMQIYEYGPTFSMIPCPGCSRTFRRMKELAKYPQIAAMGFCEYSLSSFIALSHYVIHRLNRNINADISTLIGEFMKAYYGAAAPEMRKIYDLIDSLTRNKPINILCEYYAPGTLTRQERDVFYALFSKAEKAAGDDAVVRRRIAFEKYPYLFSDLTEFNPANGKAKLNKAFASKLQECFRIYRDVRNPEWKAMKGNYYNFKMAFRLNDKIEGWPERICGLDMKGKSIYDSPVVNKLIDSKDPLAYIKGHRENGAMLAYGNNISLKNKDIRLENCIKAKNVRKFEDPDEAPMAVLWKAKSNKDTPKEYKVAPLAEGQKLKLNVPYIHNLYDMQIEVTALCEVPCEAEVYCTLISGKYKRRTIKRKIIFKKDNCMRFTFKFKPQDLTRSYKAFQGVPENKLRFGMDGSVNKVEISVKGIAGKRILVQAVRRLW